MLKHLNISNFTLIDRLDIDFHEGFSVITGETGAGKSIIIGAIGLLLGNRADAKQVKAGSNKCVIEATFSFARQPFLKAFFEENDIDYDPEECILRREVNANGKSRAFVNDTPVVLTTLRHLGEQLVDVHSQHQNLMLNNEDFQLSVVDLMANNKVLLDRYRSDFTAYKTANKELETLREENRKNQENVDFLRFQQNELEEARLTDGEQQELEQQNEMMSHAEDIKYALVTAGNYLDEDENGIISRLNATESQLRTISSVYPEAKALASRIESCLIELKDVSQELSGKAEDIEFDPDKLQSVTSRLDQIYSLEQKYHTEDIHTLLQKLEEINIQLSKIDNYDDELVKKKAEVEDMLSKCKTLATSLSESRVKAAKIVEHELSKRLIPLGIPKIRFKVELAPTPELYSDGGDKALFLFSSNSSSPLQPISQVASGGEISRVMLSLKAMVSDKSGLPTIIFDEIDTGVSGRVAEKMADIMKEMGDGGKQVICITHLPQIAAMGSHHYTVSKRETATGTVSRMRQLSDGERITEIAKMLSGSEVTQAAKENAEALLRASSDKTNCKNQ